MHCIIKACPDRRNNGINDYITVISTSQSQNEYIAHTYYPTPTSSPYRHVENYTTRRIHTTKDNIVTEFYLFILIPSRYIYLRTYHNTFEYKLSFTWWLWIFTEGMESSGIWMGVASKLKFKYKVTQLCMRRIYVEKYKQRVMHKLCKYIALAVYVYNR